MMAVDGHPKGTVVSRVARALASGALVVGFLSEAVACGYHDDVSVARGVLNWVYPDALHVVGAVSTAVAERRLPPPGPMRSGRALLGYHRTVQALTQHAQQLRRCRDALPCAHDGSAFSLLLIEPMLWTRYTWEGTDVQLQIHASGPQAGDLVVITGENVIRAIASNNLTIGDAYRSGMLRLYGTDGQVASLLASFGRVGSTEASE
jgi:hypothetical protein